MWSWSWLTFDLLLAKVEPSSFSFGAHFAHSALVQHQCHQSECARIKEQLLHQPLLVPALVPPVRVCQKQLLHQSYLYQHQWHWLGCATTWRRSRPLRPPPIRAQHTIQADQAAQHEKHTACHSLTTLATSIQSPHSSTRDIYILRRIHLFHIFFHYQPTRHMIACV